MPGLTGIHPWLDLTARLSRAPVVSIASLRGRARSAGSEFALACDIRLASDKAILAQFEVGTGVVPGGGPMARLPRLIGLTAFFASAARPATQARLMLMALASHGLGRDSELEQRLGELVTLATASADPHPTPEARAGGPGPFGSVRWT